MAQLITLAAEPRTVIGKHVKHLRSAGLTPIVVYGRGTDTVALQVTTKDLLKALSKSGGTQLVSIQVAGEKTPRMVLAKDMQRHVTRLTPLHADFYEVSMDRTVTVEVPVITVGESALVNSGEAILEVVHNTVAVEALPGDLPDAVRIDISGMVDMGDMIRVADLDLGGQAKILADPDTLLVHLASRAAAIAAAAALEAAADAVVEAGLEAGPSAEEEAEPASGDTDKE